MKAVIFDLDGVIVSTDNLHYHAWKKLANQENIEFNEEINDRLRGVSRMESLEIILEKATRTYSEEEKQNIAEFKNNIYVELLKSLSPNDILPNIVELLDGLKARDVKISIGSSSKNAKVILEYIGLIGAFDAIADGTDIKNSKPDPEVFLIAASKLGVEPSDCAVVEDAEAGIIAAKRAGMYAIAVGPAKDSGLADVNIDNALDILKYLK